MEDVANNKKSRRAEEVALGLALSNRWRSHSRAWSQCIGAVNLTVGLGGRTLARDVTGLTAAIASLAHCVQWAAVRCGAVTGDVTLID
jgi:hypothetical protein